jgi:hypothetical protein
MIQNLDRPVLNGHFPDTFWVWFSNGKIGHLVSKTGQFVQFLNAIAIQKPDRTFLIASLDRFVMNKIFVMHFSNNSPLIRYTQSFVS